MKREKDIKQRQCDNCQKQINMGQDLTTTEKCVRGPRGIVPLGKINYFCSEECVKRWFSTEPVADVPDVGFRIP